MRPSMQPVGGDDRMAAGLVEGDVLEADGGELEHDPLRCVADFTRLGWIGAHRLDAQELVELTQHRKVLGMRGEIDTVCGVLTSVSEAESTRPCRRSGVRSWIAVA